MDVELGALKSDATTPPLASHHTIAREASSKKRPRPQGPHDRTVALSLTCIAGIGVYYGYQIIGATAVQLDSEYGVSFTRIGLLVLAYSLPNTVIPLGGGILVQKWGPLHSLLIFTFVTALGSSLFSMFIALPDASLQPICGGDCSHDQLNNIRFAGLFFSQAIFGAGAESVNIGQKAILCEWFPASELAYAFSWILVLNNTGCLLCLWVSPQIFNLKVKYLLSAAISICSFLAPSLLWLLLSNGIVCKDGSTEGNITESLLQSDGLAFDTEIVSDSIDFYRRRSSVRRAWFGLEQEDWREGACLLGTPLTGGRSCSVRSLDIAVRNSTLQSSFSMGGLKNSTVRNRSRTISKRNSIRNRSRNSEDGRTESNVQMCANMHANSCAQSSAAGVAEQVAQELESRELESKEATESGRVSSSFSEEDGEPYNEPGDEPSGFCGIFADIRVALPAINSAIFWALCLSLAGGSMMNSSLENFGPAIVQTQWGQSNKSANAVVSAMRIASIVTMYFYACRLDAWQSVGRYRQSICAGLVVMAMVYAALATASEGLGQEEDTDTGGTHGGGDGGGGGDGDDHSGGGEEGGGGGGDMGSSVARTALPYVFSVIFGVGQAVFFTALWPLTNYTTDVEHWPIACGMLTTIQNIALLTCAPVAGYLIDSTQNFVATEYFLGGIGVAISCVGHLFLYVPSERVSESVLLPAEGTYQPPPQLAAAETPGGTTKGS